MLRLLVVLILREGNFFPVLVNRRRGTTDIQVEAEYILLKCSIVPESAGAGTSQRDALSEGPGREVSVGTGMKLLRRDFSPKTGSYEGEV